MASFQIDSKSRQCAFASVSLSLPGSRSPRQPARKAVQNAVFELGEATEPRLTPAYLAVHRPVALLALVPRGTVLFGAGALSGAIAKTLTAPLDRVKILLQVKGGLEGGAVAAAAAKGNLVQSLIAIGRQEGLLGYWKGNLPQVRGTQRRRAAVPAAVIPQPGQHQGSEHCRSV